MKYHLFVIAFVLASVLAKSTFAEDANWITGPNVTLKSGEVALRFVPARAWTFDELRYQDKLLNNPNSFSGLVLNFGGPLFVGSGHQEGGTEKVLSVQLTIDGTQISDANLRRGGTFTGTSIELVKESLLETNDKVTPFSSTPLKSVVRLENGVLECEQFVTPTADVNIDKIYAFMFSWVTKTTQWFAKTAKGEMRTGNFSGTNRPWELTDNVQWTSIYNPDLQIAALTTFSEDSQTGAGVRHGYWNVKNTYHKQYYQPVGKMTLEKGQTYHWSTKVLFIAATPEQWKEKVQEMAQSTTAQRH